MAGPRPAGAQDIGECPGGRISSVFVDNHSVFDLTDPDLGERLAWAYRTANRLHARTRESVIRTELLFGEGDCYDLERLRDSERLLRGLRFISDVDVYGVRQADGSVHVVVDTQDEWSTRIEPRIGGGAGLTGLRVREDNLFGTGQQVAAFYVNEEEEQVYGAAYRTPQLLGTRLDASVEVGRTPVGYLVSQGVSYPFVGEQGRWAMVQGARRHDRYFEYFLPRDGEMLAAWYPERRQGFEAGTAFRWGNRRTAGRAQTMIGAALTGEWITYAGERRFASEEVHEAGAVPPPLLRDSIASVRTLLMTGQRNVYYVRRRALDTVNGTEDVRLGVEGDVALGPSIPGISRDRDLVVGLSVSAAGELAAVAVAGLSLTVQGRRTYESPASVSEWADVFGSLDGWLYYRPTPDSRQTMVLSVDAAGGWHDRVPFQLTLGARTGLRGYPDHAYAGGRRLLTTLEHRAYLGWPLPDLFDLGTVVFADVGRMWAGDAAFGVDSPLRASAGAGLRIAFPPGSGQTLRVDFGLPVEAGAGFRDVRVSIGMGQLVGRLTADRDGQLERTARLRTSSLFLLPDRP